MPVININGKPFFVEESFEGSGSLFGVEIVKKLDEIESPFQFIEIFETKGFGNLMTIDGRFMVTTRENFFYHEMMSHPVLFTHLCPENILIIGGGDCGTLQQVLKHPYVKKVTQIDIDEQVTRMAEKYFPELCESNSDPRADIRFDDGIVWVKNAQLNSYDVIIIDSTDPVGPAVGLFGEQFYRDCINCLSSGGIICQQSESALLNLDLLIEMRQFMAKAGLNYQQTVFFPQCIYPSGWWSATMACKNNHLENPRLQDIGNFNAKYYNGYTHLASVAYPPFFVKVLKDAGLLDLY
jgi:spermidine synthase